MTRKDYELIAATLKDEIETARHLARTIDEETAVGALENLALHFARALATTNPRFDGHRFIAACGVA
jgi:hypothetical protein